MWSHDGLICTGETYKNVVKINLRRSPSGLFNSSLDGHTRRAIEIPWEGEKRHLEGVKGSRSAALFLNSWKAKS